MVNAVLAHSGYRTHGTCAGYPRVDLKTTPGICVGLVAENLGFPRGVAVIGDDIYVTDLGGWAPGKGRLLRLRGKQSPQVLLTKLNQPNTVLVTPDKRLLIGLADRIVSINPEADNPVTSMQDWVINLPGTGLHPLTTVALAPDGSLVINVGSASNNCERGSETPDSVRPCPETLQQPPRGSILQAPPPTPGKPLDAAQLPVLARGLRNSMALAFSPDGQVIAAVNARDYINHQDSKLSDEALPHDTLDWIVSGADYGWPYCFDGNRPSPEYQRYDCSQKTPPTRLLPPHAAPLGMLIYQGSALPGQKRHLILGYHGYRSLGHRIVSLALDADFRPSGDTYLRTLLIHGARSVLTHVKEPDLWVEQMKPRRPLNVVTVALANKMARMIWAIVTHGRTYQKEYVSIRSA
jgi:glucose/arabinose dehydrogenase